MKQWRHMNRGVLCGAVSLVMMQAIAAVSAADYSRSITFTLDSSRYSGADVANVHVALRLSEERIPGFRYADCYVDGRDLYVEDENGNRIDHDIETWNRYGESIVWVKMPTFGKNRRLRMYFNGPENDVVQSANVWSDCVGVWHMAEESGAVADAAGHDGYAMVPAGENTRQSVATTGAVGNGRVNSTGAMNRLEAGCKSLSLYSSFWVSGWLKCDAANPGEVALLSNRKTYNHGKGFALRIPAAANTAIKFQGASTDDAASVEARNIPMDGHWAHVTAVYGSKGVVKVYVNGEPVTTYQCGTEQASTTIAEAGDTDYSLCFGYVPSTDTENVSAPFLGAVDELRYGDGGNADKPATWVKAEYLGQADADLFTTELIASGMAPEISCAYDATTAKLTIGGSVTVPVTTGLKACLLAQAVAGRDPDVSLIDSANVAAEAEVAADGTVSFTYQGVLGTKVAYQIALCSQDAVVAGAVLPLSGRGEMTLRDNAQYIWKSEIAEGDWESADNWSFFTLPEDGLPRLGYPGYGPSVRFPKDGVDHQIKIHGYYTDLGEFRLDSGANVRVTFIGVGSGAGIRTSVWKTEAGAGGSYTCDNISVYVGGNTSTALREDSALVLRNGAVFETTSSLNLGANTQLKVLNKSVLKVCPNNDARCLEVSGTDVTIELDDSTIDTASLFYRREVTTSSTSAITPVRVLVKGEAPRLIVRKRATLCYAYPTPVVFTFVVPENGYAVAPIAKGTSAVDDYDFLQALDADCTPFTFAVDPKSPVFDKQKHIVTPVIDWSGTGKAINTAGLSLVEPKYATSGSRWLFADDNAKLNLKLDVTKALVITIR